MARAVRGANYLRTSHFRGRHGVVKVDGVSVSASDGSSLFFLAREKLRMVKTNHGSLILTEAQAERLRRWIEANPEKLRSLPVAENTLTRAAARRGVRQGTVLALAEIIGGGDR